MNIFRIKLKNSISPKDGAIIVELASPNIRSYMMRAWIFKYVGKFYDFKVTRFVLTYLNVIFFGYLLYLICKAVLRFVLVIVILKCTVSFYLLYLYNNGFEK